MDESSIKNSIDYKNAKHLLVYESLADEYKRRAIETIEDGDLLEKAQWLKEISNGDKALEIGLGGGAMNKHLSDVGFQTVGVDISSKIIENCKELNPNGEFLHGNYLDVPVIAKQDLIVALAFIHLFDHLESKEILRKMYYDLSSGGVINLTTTLENKYSYDLVPKEDYGQQFERYRAKHTVDTFKSLLDGTGLIFQELEVIDSKFDKKWMSLLAKKP